MRLSIFFLFCLGLIDVEMNHFLHNLFAGLFFIHTTRIITIDKKFPLYSIPIYLVMLFWLGGAINFYFFEIVSIMMISLFTMHYSILKIRAREFKILEVLKTMRNTIIKNPIKKLEN